MKQYIFVGSFLGLVALACATPIPLVRGGNDAADGKYPYQAYLRLKGEFVCGASILNKRWVLTAAHCLFGSDMLVVVGTNKNEGDGTVYKVRSYFPHPDYAFPYPQATVPINDIALLYLGKDIEFNRKVQPIKLPPNDVKKYENEMATLTGWGLMGPRGKATKLQEIQLTVYSQKKCFESYMNKINIPIIGNQICTLGKRGQGASSGDSGGPLAINGIQIGVVSFGSLPGGQDFPDVYARVSSYLDWINNHIN